MPAVTVLENELPVEFHPHCFACVRKRLDDLHFRSLKLVLEKVRLGAIYIHIVFDPEIAEGPCDVAGALDQYYYYVVPCQSDVRHRLVIEMRGLKSELCLVED